LGDVIKHELAPGLTIYQGHVLDALALIPDNSVQCICTSDPYWGLRSYGTDIWQGGDPDCDHAARDWDGPKQTGAAMSGHASKADRLDRDTCAKCGAKRVDTQAVDWPEVTYIPMAGLPPITVPAWRGPYGLEPDPAMYVGHSVLIRRALWRVLRDNGVQFLNLGDSYCGSGVNDGTANPGLSKAAKRGDVDKQRPGQRIAGVKPKDLVGIPWRVAFALQADGWYLRSAPPWVKGNCMPESVEDRPTTAHENIFLFSKSQAYFWDADAIRPPMVKGLAGSSFIEGKTGVNGLGRASKKEREDNPAGRNRRTSDWWNESLSLAITECEARVTHLKSIRDNGGLLLNEDGDPLGFMVNTKPFREAHFAVWPQDLVKPMILAGTSPYACPTCGAPWRRFAEKGDLVSSDGRVGKCKVIDQGGLGNSVSRAKNGDGPSYYAMGRRERTFLGWTPTCSCEANDGSGKCITLDPFSGSGTTGMVARALGRAYIGCELNPEYVEMSAKRLLGPLEVRLRELEAPAGPTQATLFDTVDEAQ